MTSKVAENLADIRRRMDESCLRCGRDPGDVELVAVSKRQPLERVQAAVQAGQRLFGENQVQEAVTKAAQLSENLSWHLIGPLQSNKVKAAARLFHVVHSVDREKIARLLSKEALRLDRTIDIFFQFNLGAETSKHGFSSNDLDRLGPLAELPGLRPVGLMAIPPYEENPEDSRRWFRRLRELRDQLATRPEWDQSPAYLSMGMSHDFHVAIEEGATHIRVGTDIFGRRPDRSNPPSLSDDRA